MVSRRIVDLFNGFVYGLSAGAFVFAVGFITGKVVVFGYSVGMFY